MKQANMPPASMPQAPLPQLPSGTGQQGFPSISVVDLTAAFAAMQGNGEGPYKKSPPSIFTRDQDKAEIFMSKFS
jgi:hypothetical protein